jgi:hypothetical protein
MACNRDIFTYLHILEVTGAPFDTAVDSLYTANGKGVSKVLADCN